MSVYISNEGEKETLKAILLQRAITIGLYGNSVVPDGNTLFSTLTELTAGVGYGYAPIALPNLVKEGAAAAGWWTILTVGVKATAVYAAQVWTFLTPDVALLPTVYGVFGYTRTLAFTAGIQPIKVGDVVYQGTTKAAEVTGVNVTSGSWVAGDAAGFLYLKNQIGSFAAGADLKNGSRPTSTSEIKTVVAIPIAAGTGYAVGDFFLIATGTGGVGRVTSITPATGAVLTVEIISWGHDYTAVPTTSTTTKISGAGDNNLTVSVTALWTGGPAVSIATIAADSVKQLVFVEALTTPIPITALGQTITYTPTLTMASG